MRDELKQVMKDVRRNEAVIEYLYLRGELPQAFRFIGDITHGIMAQLNAMEDEYASTSSQ